MLLCKVKDSGQARIQSAKPPQCMPTAILKNLYQLYVYYNLFIPALHPLPKKKAQKNPKTFNIFLNI